MMRTLAQLQDAEGYAAAMQRAISLTAEQAMSDNADGLEQVLASFREQGLDCEILRYLDTESTPFGVMRVRLIVHTERGDFPVDAESPADLPDKLREMGFKL